MIFSSETGQWSKSTFSFYLPGFRYGCLGRQFVSNNGMLYSAFTATDAKAEGVVALDAFNNDTTDPERCRFIGLSDCFRFEDETRFGLGVVRGRLCLSQLFKTAPTFSTLRIWELNSASSSWDLVEEARVAIKNKGSVSELVSVLAFDPNSSNIIILLSDQKICRHRIWEDKYESIDEFSFRMLECESIHRRVWAFTLV